MSTAQSLLKAPIEYRTIVPLDLIVVMAALGRIGAYAGHATRRLQSKVIAVCVYVEGIGAAVVDVRSRFERQLGEVRRASMSPMARCGTLEACCSADAWSRACSLPCWPPVVARTQKAV